MYQDVVLAIFSCHEINLIVACSGMPSGSLQLLGTEPNTFLNGGEEHLPRETILLEKDKIHFHMEASERNTRPGEFIWLIFTVEIGLSGLVEERGHLSVLEGIRAARGDPNTNMKRTCTFLTRKTWGRTSQQRENHHASLCASGVTSHDKDGYSKLHRHWELLSQEDPFSCFNVCFLLLLWCFSCLRWRFKKSRWWPTVYRNMILCLWCILNISRSLLLQTAKQFPSVLPNMVWPWTPQTATQSWKDVTNEELVVLISKR